MSVELGVDFGCALRASGEVACWGWNNAGQTSPPQGRVSVLAVGSDFACGIRVGGAVECWGNTGGWPLATPDGEFIDIASGDGFACGVRAGGSVACWGDYTATASLPADTGFVSIALGPEYACAERGDGSGTCWPKGEVGFAGLDYDFDLFEIYDNFRLGSLGTERACGIGEAGDVSCWLFFGLDGFGQDSPPPGEFVAVDVTHTFTCGVRADGEVECWGAQSAVPCVGGAGCPCALGGDGKLACRETPQSPAPCWPPTTTDEPGGCGPHWVLPCSWGDCWGWGIDATPEGPFRAISVAPGWSREPVPICGVRVDGALECWNSGRYSPQPPEGPFAAVDAGLDFFCGVRVGGAPACWGSGAAGWVLPAGEFTSLSAGAHHACGLLTDGQARCWGADTDGENEAPQGPFTAIATGDAVACALRPSGEATCWGSNTWWVATPPAGPFVALSVGSETACGLRPDLSAACWGRLDGSTPPEGEFVSLSVQMHATSAACGLRPAGNIHCWASLDQGLELSPQQEVVLSRARWGAANWRLEPSRTDEQGGQGAVAFDSVAGAFGYRCGLRADATAVCWHDSYHWWDYSPPGIFSDIAASRLDACGIRPGGELECWNPLWPSWVRFPPPLPPAAEPEDRSGVPEALTWVGDEMPPGPFTAIDSGDSVTCGLRADATAQCWGATSGTDVMPTPPGTFTSISVAGRYACGIRPDREPHCWITRSGEPTSEVSVPAGPFETLDVSGIGVHGIRPDGTLTCWREGFVCQERPGRFTKVDTGSGLDYRSSAARLGDSEVIFAKVHSCGIRRAGTLACWGSNDHGESIPPRHADGAAYTDVAAGFAHTCILDATGKAICWGDGIYGQTNAPEGPFTAISAGMWHTCALRTDGNIACWGNGPAAHRHEYDEPPESYPTQPPPGPYIAVSAGAWHTCALRTDGEAACWLSY